MITADPGRVEGETVQLVTFRLGDDEYAVDILSLKEITRMSKLTPVPNVPAFVEGVINLRGQVVPVIDMRKRFGLDPAEPSEATRIMIVKMGERLAGIIVDSVAEVFEKGASDIEEPPRVIAGLKGKFIKGIVKTKGRLFILLDIEHILSSEEKIELQRAANGDLMRAGLPGD